MRIYIVADSGKQTAFKVTTSRVVDNLDFIIDEARLDYIEGSFVENIRDIIKHDFPYECIYYNELNGENVSKKLTKKIWKEIVLDYAKRKGIEL